MKILYISNCIIPSRTANSIQIMKMCQAFSDNRHEIVLLAPNRKNHYEKRVYDVYKFYGVKKIFKLKKLWYPNIKCGVFLYLLAIFFYLLFSKKFNLVYGRFLPGCYVAALLNNNVFFETHENLFQKKTLKLLFFKKLIKNKFFKKLIVISQALKNIYLKNGYLHDSIIQVAHDGADDLKNFNSKIDLLGSPDKLKVGYVGNLYKGRGIKTIIECAQKINDMTFHIVGGLKEDIDYWKSYLKKFDLDNLYFYGFVPPKETVRYLNSFDILLAPYKRKVTISGLGDTSKFMSPIKIFEYMSHKKPIIVSDLPVIREVLNVKNSILVDPDNIKLWINSIKKLKDSKKRERLSQQALNDFKIYTWKNRASSII